MVSAMQVHTLLSCIIVGGLVSDTSIDSIAATFRTTTKERRTSANSGSLTASFADVGGANGWDKLTLALRGGRS